MTAAESHQSKIKQASLSDLKNEIIKPGIERFLRPLLLLGGSRPLGPTHRLFNFAIAMMKTECPSLTEGVVLSHNEDYAQLCGPEKKAQHSSLKMFFNRLRNAPDVTNNISGLTEYVEWIHPHKYELRRVSLFSARRNCAPWRVYKPHPKALASGGANISPEDIKSSELVYPYVVYEKGNPLNRLTALVNAVVPRGIAYEFRADICQDLIVDLLSGDLSEDALIGSPRKYVGQKMASYRYRASDSLDAELVDILQADEAWRKFDEHIEREIERMDTDPFKDMVEEKLGSVFRVVRQGKAPAAVTSA